MQHAKRGDYCTICNSQRSGEIGAGVGIGSVEAALLAIGVHCLIGQLGEMLAYRVLLLLPQCTKR